MGDGAHKARQSASRRRFQFFRIDNVFGHAEQRFALPARRILQCLHGDIAEAAAWFVANPLKRQIIINLRNQPQISIGIANFGTLIKARTANHAIGNTQRNKTVFKFAHLERGSHQHRHFIKRLTAALIGFNIIGRHPRFFFAIPHAAHLYRLAIFIAVRP